MLDISKIYLKVQDCFQECKKIQQAVKATSFEESNKLNMGVENGKCGVSCRKLSTKENIFTTLRIFLNVESINEVIIR